MIQHLKPKACGYAALFAIVSVGALPAQIIARFDPGDTTASSIQSTFTAIGAVGTSPAAFPGPRTATSGSVTLRLVAGTNLAAATSKDASGDFNSTANLVARNRNAPGADIGGFTNSDIYRDFVTANSVMGIQLSGLAPNSSHAITFYVYDDLGNRTQTYTDVTPGGTGNSGSVTYTSGHVFDASTSNEIFSTVVNATSDSSGRLFFTATGVGNTNVGILGGLVVDSTAVAPAFAGFHHAYNGGFADSSSAGNSGIPVGNATITSDPAVVVAGSGALSLDGADNSHVNLTTPGNYGPSSPWTAMWWARRGEIGAQKGMVMGLANTTSDFIWLNDGFDGLRFRSSANTTFDFTTPKDQELRHYALVADGLGDLSLYLNGELSQTRSGTTSFAVDTIGKAYPTTSLKYNFQGTLDEVRLLGVALSAGQIEALYDNERPRAPVTRLRVVLLGGQSNADGRAVVSDLPTSPLNLQVAQGDVDFFYKVEGGMATLGKLAPGLSESSQFGPEVLLGRKLADLHQTESGTRVAIIKYANGGTSLATHWKAGGDATTSGDGVDYVAFQQTVTQGLAALAAAYPLATLELQAMAWFQGESDATAALSGTYQANLTALIADVRATFGASLPFVIGRLSSSQTSINATYLGTIRTAQAAVADGDPRTEIINTDGFGMKTDNLHFDGNGQQAIGRAFAAETAYYAWMNEAFTPAQITAGLGEPDVDSDGDGQVNRAEFLAAADPLSGNSVFRAAVDVSVPGAVSIAYASSAARIYTVQHYNEITSLWETALPALRGTGQSVVRPLGVMQGRGLYRVRSELP